MWFQLLTQQKQTENFLKNPVKEEASTEVDMAFPDSKLKNKW